MSDNGTMSVAREISGGRNSRVGALIAAESLEGLNGGAEQLRELMALGISDETFWHFYVEQHGRRLSSLCYDAKHRRLVLAAEQWLAADPDGTQGHS